LSHHSLGVDIHSLGVEEREREREREREIYIEFMKKSLNPKEFSNGVCNDLYSASVEECETAGCFLKLHEIKFKPRKTQ